MKEKTPITDIVLDFDGTCTQIPVIYKGFIKNYFDGFAKQMEAGGQPISVSEWEDALSIVGKNSPHAAWTLATSPSAPAAADPYILTFEAACFILRKHKIKSLPDSNIFKNAYDANKPPWRNDAAPTFIALQKKGIGLHFISNSSTKKIEEQLLLLQGVAKIPVEGDAAKYNIRELLPETEEQMPAMTKRMFDHLPAACTNKILKDLSRPVYLRRGSYFEAICRTFNNDLARLKTTVFCGDIWELDLAMPYELGASIHLVERADPFTTYDYERKMVEGYGDRAKISKDLSPLLEWI